MASLGVNPGLCARGALGGTEALDINCGSRSSAVG